MCDEFWPIGRHGTAVHEIGSIAKRILDIPIWVVVAGLALAARRSSYRVTALRAATYSW